MGCRTGERNAVVMGAGVAGLIAAQTLKSVGFDVVVSISVLIPSQILWVVELNTSES